MPRTKIDVCNAALAMVGANAIVSFDDGSTESIVCAQLYENLIGRALLTPGGSPMRWSFASRQERLAALTETPAGRWSKAWQTPALCLKIHAVTENGHNINFAIYGDKIFTDQHTDLICDHSFRPDEGAWPPDFADAVSHEMAFRLAIGLNENAELAAELRRTMSWDGVRTADSQQRTSRRFRATRLRAARFGR